jgi:hypothetical protein
MKRSLPDDSEARAKAIDKLACVSRVMFDQRVLDLRKENEELHAKVAWYEYGEKRLRESLVAVNQTYYGGTCHCFSCYHAKRFETGDGLDGFPTSFLFRNLQTSIEMKRKPCLIKECLLLQTKKMGFEVATLNESSAGFAPPDFSVEHIPADPVPETCHLIIWSHPVDSYWRVEYGPKLCSKDFHKNPMLEKLKQLFKILEDADAEEFFKTL